MRWTILILFLVCVAVSISRGEEDNGTPGGEETKAAVAVPRRRLFRKRLLSSSPAKDETQDKNNVTTSFSMSVSTSDSKPQSLFSRLKPKLRLTPNLRLTKLEQVTPPPKERTPVTSRVKIYPPKERTPVTSRVKIYPTKATKPLPTKKAFKQFKPRPSLLSTTTTAESGYLEEYEEPTKAESVTKPVRRIPVQKGYSIKEIIATPNELTTKSYFTNRRRPTPRTTTTTEIPEPIEYEELYEDEAEELERAALIPQEVVFSVPDEAFEHPEEIPAGPEEALEEDALEEEEYEQPEEEYEEETQEEPTTTAATTTQSTMSPLRARLGQMAAKRPKLTLKLWEKDTNPNFAATNSPYPKKFQPATKPPKKILTAGPPSETPHSSFRAKVRPNFGKRPTNRPVVKPTLRKLWRGNVRTTAATVNDEVITEDQAVPDVQTTTTTTSTAATTGSGIGQGQGSETAASNVAQVEAQSAPASSEQDSGRSKSGKTKPKDMIIIPVPPSQRKPYHPVIMQVTQSPSHSTTEKPQTKIVTYKLNKMFVPMGIYGKVLPKSEIQSEASENVHNTATISPTIKHKGTSSEELLTSDDSSGDYGSAVSPSTSTTPSAGEPDALFSSAQEWRPAFTRPGPKGKQFADASQVDLTMDYKPDISTISLTTKRPNINDVSLTSTESPFTNNRQHYSPYNTLTQMAPPPQRFFEKRPASFVESIKSAVVSAASSLPGVIHGGLTQLSHFSPFDDSQTAQQHQIPQGQQTYFPNSTPNPAKLQPVSPNPTAGGVSVGAPDEETLEYFRKRPHLVQKGQNGFQQPNYASGFKPVTAPAHFAKAYYASTPTTPSPSSTTPESSHVSSTPTSFFESHDKPSVISREPKTVGTDEYVEQLLESSQKYKYASTASPFERDAIKSQWDAMNEKYSKNEIEAATNTIYKLISGPNPPSIDEMLYMRPPGPKSQWSRSSSSAFHDMLKMFRLGFSYGTSHGNSRGGKHQPVQHVASVGNLRSSSVSDDDGWRPIRPGGNSFVSFNAGISFGSTPRPTPAYSGTHFSSSSRPFIPGYAKAKPSSSSHYGNSFSGVEEDYSAIGGKGKDEYSSSSYSVQGDNSEYSAPSAYAVPEKDEYSASSAYAVPEKDEYSVSSSYVSGNGKDEYPGQGQSYSTGNDKDEYSVGSSYSAQKETGGDYADSYLSAPDSDSASYKDSYYNPASDSSSHSHIGSSSSSNFRYTKGRYDNGRNPNYRQTPENLATLYENDPAIELIPSSQYYKQKEAGIFSSGEIAAVLKPNGMASDEVRAQLPKTASHVPQISYPNGKLPTQFQTLNQVQQYFQSSDPTSLNQAHFQPPLLRIIQQSFNSQDQQLQLHNQALKIEQPSFASQTQQQQEYKPQPQPIGIEQYRQQQQSKSHNRYQHQHHQHQNIQHQSPAPTYTRTQAPAQAFSTQQFSHSHAQNHNLQNHNTRIRFEPAYPSGQQQSHGQGQQQLYQSHAPQQAPGSVKVKAQGDSGLGFSDFELPAGVDPDIAALLKAELDKDDIPVEFRKEFEEQEKAKKGQQQQQPQGGNQNPQSHQQHQHQHGPVRRDGEVRPEASSSSEVKTIFHKPIPINPTALSKTRRPAGKTSAAIPKYVVDLARKLRNDKNLLGIVRVTSKKEGGPPIEYLYPVRG